MLDKKKKTIYKKKKNRKFFISYVNFFLLCFPVNFWTRLFVALYIRAVAIEIAPLVKKYKYIRKIIINIKLVRS